jgi:hypothetical protein
MKSETHAPEILMRAHDAVVAQPISQIIITSEAWLHTFEVSFCQNAQRSSKSTELRLICRIIEIGLHQLHFSTVWFKN